MTDAIVAEQAAWAAYRSYAVRRTPSGQVENFTGDDASRALWLIWKAAYEARWVSATPFYRRSSGIRFGRKT